MTELELIRTPGDRRRYALEDNGTIHLEGLFARSANAKRAVTTGNSSAAASGRE